MKTINIKSIDDERLGKRYAIHYDFSVKGGYSGRSTFSNEGLGDLVLEAIYILKKENVHNDLVEIVTQGNFDFFELKKLRLIFDMYGKSESTEVKYSQAEL